MTEAAAIARSGGPITRERIIVDLRRLGVEPGMTVLVHCALSRIGWVCGGARTLIEAILQTVGPRGTEGTVVMPAQSAELSDPSGWCDPPVPERWWETIRGAMPAFDPRLTPTRGMGCVAELFRTWPGAARSTHPQVSFAALGPLAAEILARQPLDDPFGADSPLEALMRHEGHVLMLGTGWDACTGLHRAERIAWPDGKRIEDGAPLLVDGDRQWVRFTAPLLDSARFEPIGARLDGSALVRHGHVGAAASRLFPLAPAVALAARAWQGTAQ